MPRPKAATPASAPAGVAALLNSSSSTLSSGASGATNGSNGGSSGGSAGSFPVSMQELYSNPEARLFAVGYAARHISSGAQLERLLSNPPAPAGLRVAPTDWATHHLQVNVPEGLLCGACGAQLAAEEHTILSVCACCSKICCSLDCLQRHHAPAACEPDPATLMARCHHWRVLDLLRPVSSQPAQSGVPAALNNSLSDSFNMWLPATKQQQAPELQQPPTRRNLFRIFGSSRAQEPADTEDASSCSSSSSEADSATPRAVAAPDLGGAHEDDANSSSKVFQQQQYWAVLQQLQSLEGLEEPEGVSTPQQQRCGDCGQATGMFA